MTAVGKLSKGTAPGPDGVPNEIVAAVAGAKQGVLLSVLNVCLMESIFPDPWKTAKLVLVHKGQGKPLSEPSSYRPISMLNSCGKLLERLVLTRLEAHLDSAPGGKSDNQFGFRKGRWTTDAIGRVMRAADKAGSGKVQDRDLCVIVTLDVRNAFNSVPWPYIDVALQSKKPPQQLVQIIGSYLQGRSNTAGAAGREITCGIPQGSVIGSTLWNVMYDDLLEMPAPSV